MQSVRQYQDVNVNLRYWLDRIFASLTDPVFYDLGANDGVFALSYAGRSKVVYAFEPSRAAHERLTERIRSVDAGNVHTYRVALADSSDRLRLHKFSDDTFNSLYQRTDFELGHYSLRTEDPEWVPVVRLDDFVASEGLEDPHVMKIDIEGAELFALRGAKRVITRSKPVILVEYSMDNTANAGYDRREIAETLIDWGYSPYGLYRNQDISLRPGHQLDDRGIWNLLCLPAELTPEYFGTNKSTAG
jgi:FkbM family methyltransferase